MTCEDTPACISWEVQLYEPFSRVWICRGYGRTSTSAPPDDLARALLAGYLAATPPRSGETFRAVARPDTGEPSTITTAQLSGNAWTADAAVCQALPRYLREALRIQGP